MKASLFDSEGIKKGELELPEIFNSKIREDIVFKFFEASKSRQPYAPYSEAGRRHSASGTISHRRHEWKGHYGRGVSRIPRKTMWRRGTQFYWIGAEVSSARGGRRAHPPKLNRSEKKINKKEQEIAMKSAFAATARKDLVLARYSSLKSLKDIPVVIESYPKKTKDFISMIKKIFGENFNIAIKNKSIRAGKGKTRGRKYKSNAGALLIVSSEENAKFKGIEIKNVKKVSISDLYPLGRLTIYTKKALEEIGAKK